MLQGAYAFHICSQVDANMALPPILASPEDSYRQQRHSHIVTHVANLQLQYYENQLRAFAIVY